MPKGMVLAAGFGERLRPLTEWKPKPLLPVANVPVMAQGIARLRSAAITDICVNVSYRAQDIQNAFGDGKTLGVDLHWSVEPAPLGTAGGMKNAECFLRGDTVVMVPGDAALDVDLALILELHKSLGALATIGTLGVQDPSQYGVVVTDAEGRIQQFQEKPPAGTQISNQANTGIYVFAPEVFDLIPPGEFFDFAHGLFPILLERGLPFFAHPVEGYWTDIGNSATYLNANMDYLGGKLQVEGGGELIGGSLIGHGSQVAGARLTNCVIGPGAVTPSGSALTDCVVWEGTVLTESVVAINTIFTPFGQTRVG